MKTITLICPVYNASLYLNELLDSLNQQIFKDFIVIFVDDGSVDNSVELINNYNSEFEYLIIKQQNKGAPAARNLGMTYVNTPYVYFFDADDKLQPKTLEILFELIIKEKSDIVLGNMECIGKEEEEIKAKTFPSQLETAMNWIPTPGVHLFKSSIIKENNIMFSNIRIGQDLNFVLKYLSYCKKLTFTKSIVYSYRIDSPGISRTYSKKIFDIVSSLEEAEQYFKEDKIFFDLKLKNYYSQFSKFVYFNDFQEKCEVYYYFLDKLYSLKPCNSSQVFQKSRVLLKVLLKFIKLYV